MEAVMMTRKGVPAEYYSEHSQESGPSSFPAELVLLRLVLSTFPKVLNSHFLLGAHPVCPMSSIFFTTLPNQSVRSLCWLPVSVHCTRHALPEELVMCILP